MVRFHPGRPFVHNYVEDIAKIVIQHIKDELFKRVPLLRNLAQYRGSAPYTHLLGSYVYYESTILVIKLAEAGNRRHYVVELSVNNNELVLRQNGSASMDGKTFVVGKISNTTTIALEDPQAFNKAVSQIATSVDNFWRVGMNRNLYSYVPSNLIIPP